MFALTDEEGAVTQKYRYDPFGAEVVTVATEASPNREDVNPFRYCGEEYDAGLSQLNLRARWYTPALGRFTSEDPAKDGTNWYAYCANDPVNFKDPSGLEYVMVRFIAEKNGGSAYMDSNGCVHVTINGITHSYPHPKIIAGRAVVNYSVIADDFNLPDYKTHHEAGDSFARPEDAALAFMLKYDYLAYGEMQEYAANIDKIGDSYTFSNVTSSASTFRKEPIDLTYGERHQTAVNPNDRTVGLVHIHWNPTESYGFSESDYRQMRGKYFLILLESDKRVWVSYPTWYGHTEQEHIFTM